MLRVGIVGASGYTGVELTRLISRHEKADLTVATSRRQAGKALSQVFPNLAGITDIVCEDVVVEDLTGRADLFFTAVPHKTAMDMVPQLLAAGKKVVDLSADFRIHDAAVYEEWYQPHSAPEFLGEAIYGIPELRREQIKTARLVANPGCYPTSVILALAPLLTQDIIDSHSIVVDSKSGASGAGRSAQVGNLFCEVADGFRAYKVGSHRHTPEMEQEISLLAKEKVKISFTPHLVPMSRGILSTVYAGAKKTINDSGLFDIYSSFYGEESFVRICKPGDLPATQFVRGSNYCDIGFKFDERTGRIIIISAIDNIVKGASGQAIQNMNLMCGFPEAMGLETPPLFP